jgi:excinuclease ABC subunit C
MVPASALRNLPAAPGVYLFRGDGGRVLYVGKADSLRHRVRSYFAPAARHEPRIVRMVEAVTNIEVITTTTISEA